MNRFTFALTLAGLAGSCFAQAAVTAYPLTTVITTVTTSTVTGPGAAPIVETTSTTSAFPVAGAHMKAAPVAAALAATPAQASAGTTPIASITKAQTGEFVSIEGTIADYRASRSERAPHSFYVKNGADSMRVCIWPDIFAKVVGKEKLAAAGGKVKLTAEVAEFQDKIELHLGDPTEIQF